MFDFLCSTSLKLQSQIKANSIDSSSVSKSIMFVIGGLCDCSPGGTENPNYTTASDMKIKGTYLVPMMAQCQLNIKNIKSVALNWDGTSPSGRHIFLDDGNPVAHIYISFAGWSLDPLSTMRKCVHRKDSLMAMSTANMTFPQNLANNTDAQSSSLSNTDQP